MRNKNWTPHEDNVLYKLYSYESYPEMESILNRNRRSIWDRAKALGLKRERTFGFMSYEVIIKDNMGTIIAKRKFFNPKSSKCWKNRAITEMKARYFSELFHGKYTLSVIHGFEQYK